MNRSVQSKLASPLPTFEVVALTVGVVVGTSVYRTPSLGVQNTGGGVLLGVGVLLFGLPLLLQRKNRNLESNSRELTRYLQ